MKMKTKSIIIKTIIQWKVELEFLHVVSLIERLSSRQVDRLTGRRIHGLILSFLQDQCFFNLKFLFLIVYKLNIIECLIRDR